MDNYNTLENPSNTMTTVFMNLKQQQYALNMQIRLAMQIHDAQAQADLEKEMEEITEKIKHFSM